MSERLALRVTHLRGVRTQTLDGHGETAILVEVSGWIGTPAAGSVFRCYQQD
jgi:hypothetical protein